MRARGNLRLHTQNRITAKMSLAEESMFPVSSGQNRVHSNTSHDSRLTIISQNPTMNSLNSMNNSMNGGSFFSQFRTTDGLHGNPSRLGWNTGEAGIPSPFDDTFLPRGDVMTDYQYERHGYQGTMCEIDPEKLVTPIKEFDPAFPISKNTSSANGKSLSEKLVSRVKWESGVKSYPKSAMSSPCKSLRLKSGSQRKPMGGSSKPTSDAKSELRAESPSGRLRLDMNSVIGTPTKSATETDVIENPGIQTPFEPKATIFPDNMAGDLFPFLATVFLMRPDETLEDLEADISRMNWKNHSKFLFQDPWNLSSRRTLRDLVDPSSCSFDPEEAIWIAQEFALQPHDTKLISEAVYRLVIKDLHHIMQEITMRDKKNWVTGEKKRNKNQPGPLNGIYEIPIQGPLKLKDRFLKSEIHAYYIRLPQKPSLSDWSMDLRTAKAKSEDPNAGRVAQLLSYLTEAEIRRETRRALLKGNVINKDDQSIVKKEWRQAGNSINKTEKGEHDDEVLDSNGVVPMWVDGKSLVDGESSSSRNSSKITSKKQRTSAMKKSAAKPSMKTVKKTPMRKYVRKPPTDDTYTKETRPEDIDITEKDHLMSTLLPQLESCCTPKIAAHYLMNCQKCLCLPRKLPFRGSKMPKEDDGPDRVFVLSSSKEWIMMTNRIRMKQKPPKVPHKNFNREKLFKDFEKWVGRETTPEEHTCLRELEDSADPFADMFLFTLSLAGSVVKNLKIKEIKSVHYAAHHLNQRKVAKFPADIMLASEDNLWRSNSPKDGPNYIQILKFFYDHTEIRTRYLTCKCSRRSVSSDEDQEENSMKTNDPTPFRFGTQKSNKIAVTEINRMQGNEAFNRNKLKAADIVFCRPHWHSDSICIAAASDATLDNIAIGRTNDKGESGVDLKQEPNQNEELSDQEFFRHMLAEVMNNPETNHSASKPWPIDLQCVKRHLADDSSPLSSNIPSSGSFGEPLQLLYEEDFVSKVDELLPFHDMENRKRVSDSRSNIARFLPVFRNLVMQRIVMDTYRGKYEDPYLDVCLEFSAYFHEPQKFISSVEKSRKSCGEGFLLFQTLFDQIGERFEMGPMPVLKGNQKPKATKEADRLMPFVAELRDRYKLRLAGSLQAASGSTAASDLQDRSIFEWFEELIPQAMVSQLHANSSQKSTNNRMNPRWSDNSVFDKMNSNNINGFVMRGMSSTNGSNVRSPSLSMRRSLPFDAPLDDPMQTQKGLFESESIVDPFKMTGMPATLLGTPSWFDAPGYPSGNSANIPLSKTLLEWDLLSLTGKLASNTFGSVMAKEKAETPVPWDVMSFQSLNRRGLSPPSSKELYATPPNLTTGTNGRDAHGNLRTPGAPTFEPAGCFTKNQGVEYSFTENQGVESPLSFGRGAKRSLDELILEATGSVVIGSNESSPKRRRTMSPLETVSEALAEVSEDPILDPENDQLIYPSHDILLNNESHSSKALLQERETVQEQESMHEPTRRSNNTVLKSDVPKPSQLVFPKAHHSLIPKAKSAVIRRQDGVGSQLRYTARNKNTSMLDAALFLESVGYLHFGIPQTVPFAGANEEKLRRLTAMQAVQQRTSGILFRPVMQLIGNAGVGQKITSSSSKEVALEIARAVANRKSEIEQPETLLPRLPTTRKSKLTNLSKKVVSSSHQGNASHPNLYVDDGWDIFSEDDGSDDDSLTRCYVPISLVTHTEQAGRNLQKSGEAREGMFRIETLFGKTAIEDFAIQTSQVDGKSFERYLPHAESFSARVRGIAKLRFIAILSAVMRREEVTLFSRERERIERIQHSGICYLKLSDLENILTFLCEDLISYEVRTDSSDSNQTSSLHGSSSKGVSEVPDVVEDWQFNWLSWDEAVKKGKSRQKNSVFLSNPITHVIEYVDTTIGNSSNGSVTVEQEIQAGQKKRRSSIEKGEAPTAFDYNDMVLRTTKQQWKAITFYTRACDDTVKAILEQVDREVAKDSRKVAPNGSNVKEGISQMNSGVSSSWSGSNVEYVRAAPTYQMGLAHQLSLGNSMNSMNGPSSSYLGQTSGILNGRAFYFASLDSCIDSSMGSPRAGWNISSEDENTAFNADRLDSIGMLDISQNPLLRECFDNERKLKRQPWLRPSKFTAKLSPKCKDQLTELVKQTLIDVLIDNGIRSRFPTLEFADLAVNNSNGFYTFKTRSGGGPIQVDGDTKGKQSKRLCDVALRWKIPETILQQYIEKNPELKAKYWTAVEPRKGFSKNFGRRQQRRAENKAILKAKRDAQKEIEAKEGNLKPVPVVPVMKKKQAPTEASAMKKVAAAKKSRTSRNVVNNGKNTWEPTTAKVKREKEKMKQHQEKAQQKQDKVVAKLVKEEEKAQAKVKREEDAAHAKFKKQEEKVQKQQEKIRKQKEKAAMKKPINKKGASSASAQGDICLVFDGSVIGMKDVMDIDNQVNDGKAVDEEEEDDLLAG